MKVAVLGATGMLGSQVLKTFEEGHQHQLTATCRPGNLVKISDEISANVVELDAIAVDAQNIIDLIGGCDWWINCIGIIKPYIDDTSPSEVAHAICVNSLFPAILAQAAKANGNNVIQIATDCVWDGLSGGYFETSHHNASDVYGRSKSLGEVRSSFMHFIRCSIVGREIKNHLSLLDWFLGQTNGAQLRGFINHHWNGVTALQFARVCRGIIEQDMALKSIQHLVPAGQVSKHELLRLFAKHFERHDISILPSNSDESVDRTLKTTDPAHNAEMWRCGGYQTIPDIDQSVAELAAQSAP